MKVRHFRSFFATRAESAPFASLREHSVVGVYATYWVEAFAEYELYAHLFRREVGALEGALDRFLAELSSRSIVPFFVFDGIVPAELSTFHRCVPSLVAKQLEELNEQRSERVVLQQTVGAEVDCLLEQLRALLERRRVLQLLAPYAAHSQLFYLLSIGVVHYVFGPAEFVLFGVPAVLVALRADGVRTLAAAQVEATLGLAVDCLPAVAAICGTSFSVSNALAESPDFNLIMVTASMLFKSLAPDEFFALMQTLYPPQLVEYFSEAARCLQIYARVHPVLNCDGSLAVLNHFGPLPVANFAKVFGHPLSEALYALQNAGRLSPRVMRCFATGVWQDSDTALVDLAVADALHAALLPQKLMTLGLVAGATHPALATRRVVFRGGRAIERASDLSLFFEQRASEQTFVPALPKLRAAHLSKEGLQRVQALAAATLGGADAVLVPATVHCLTLYLHALGFLKPVGDFALEGLLLLDARLAPKFADRLALLRAVALGQLHGSALLASAESPPGAALQSCVTSDAPLPPEVDPARLAIYERLLLRCVLLLAPDVAGAAAELASGPFSAELAAAHRLFSDVRRLDNELLQACLFHTAYVGSPLFEDSDQFLALSATQLLQAHAARGEPAAGEPRETAAWTAALQKHLAGLREKPSKALAGSLTSEERVTRLYAVLQTRFASRERAPAAANLLFALLHAEPAARGALLARPAFSALPQLLPAVLDHMLVAAAALAALEKPRQEVEDMKAACFLLGKLLPQLGAELAGEKNNFVMLQAFKTILC